MYTKFYIFQPLFLVTQRMSAKVSRFFFRAIKNLINIYFSTWKLQTPIDILLSLDILTGDVTGIKALASVTVTVAMVLAVLAGYLCLSRNKQSCSCKGDYQKYTLENDFKIMNMHNIHNLNTACCRGAWCFLHRVSVNQYIDIMWRS